MPPAGHVDDDMFWAHLGAEDVAAQPGDDMPGEIVEDDPDVNDLFEDDDGGGRCVAPIARAAARVASS